MNDPNGKGVVVDPQAKLEEELIIRPTSETIIWSTYKNWISSYRDLPILCNQWCNVMRWEMRTRLFLRTAEFLWQEGHTAHATKEEAEDYARQMLDVYADFATNVMAIPVVKGVKSPNERFAGALNTYCIEAMMQDGKALQAGTSHFLGQNFAKSFDVQFLNKENKYEYVWATSWGVSTRLMGALIMTHSDDNGLVLPPHLAPIQVVIVPIFKKQDDLEKLLVKLNPIADELKALGIRVKVDTDEKYTPGYKFADYELKGVPVRLAMGGRDLENETIEIARRDTQTKETISIDGIAEIVKNLLEEIQKNLLQKALDFRIANTREVNSYDEFKEELKKGGFLLAHWDGTPETEQRIKEYLTPGTDERPSWEKDDSLYMQYEQSMSIQVVPQAFLTSYISEDDLMCATIGDQVRAVSGPEENEGEFYFPLVIAGKGNEGNVDLAYYCSKLNRIYIAKDWHAFDSDFSPTKHGLPYEIVFYEY